MFLLSVLAAKLLPLVLDSRHCLLLRCVDDGGDGVLLTAEGNELVRVGSKAAEVRVVLMGEKYPDLSWEPLQTEGSKEDAVVLHGWADLLHVGKELRRFAGPQRLHGEEELDTLEIGELVAGQ